MSNLPGRPTRLDDQRPVRLEDMDLAPETRRRLKIKAEVAKVYAPAYESLAKMAAAIDRRLSRLERRR